MEFKAAHADFYAGNQSRVDQSASYCLFSKIKLWFPTYSPSDKKKKKLSFNGIFESLSRLLFCPIFQPRDIKRASSKLSDGN